MQGQWPTPQFLARIERGEIGGIVLFQNNTPRVGVLALVQRLQAAAKSGGQLPLVIATDQEGGSVKRFPGPPTVAPSAMRRASDPLAQGVSTGRYLRTLGINLDLAPVVDVPVSSSSFIAGRAFSSNGSVVGILGSAFSSGLIRGGVAATAKHFAGLGRLTQSTDDAPGVVRATTAQLQGDLAPFRAVIRAGVPAVMVGTAIYPSYGNGLPAACSRPIVNRLLRQMLGFKGVAIADDLDTAAVSSSLPPPEAAVRAVAAGIDFVYIAGVNGSGGDAISEKAYAALLRAAQQGVLKRSDLEESYARILALKQKFAGA
jgi:beta-N-acetylhexosaminidase